MNDKGHKRFGIRAQRRDDLEESTVVCTSTIDSFERDLFGVSPS